MTFPWTDADASSSARPPARICPSPRPPTTTEFAGTPPWTPPGAAAGPVRLRRDFAISTPNNLVHGSDSEESAKREIALWFKPGEVVGYEIAGSEWVEAGV